MNNGKYNKKYTPKYDWDYINKKYLDSKIQEINNNFEKQGLNYSLINKTFSGYWIDGVGKKYKKYTQEFRYDKTSINPGDTFDLTGLTSVIVKQYLKLEIFYDSSGDFVSLPFTSNTSGSSTPGHLSGRILKTSNSGNTKGVDYVRLFGNLSYGGAGTLIIRVEYIKN